MHVHCAIERSRVRNISMKTKHFWMNGPKNLAKTWLHSWKILWQSRVKLSYRGSESEGPVYCCLDRQVGRPHTHLSRPPPRNPFERPEGGEKMAVGVVVRAR